MERKRKKKPFQLILNKKKKNVKEEDKIAAMELLNVKSKKKSKKWTDWNETLLTIWIETIIKVDDELIDIYDHNKIAKSNKW